jgi:hypothetical protein
LKPNAVRVRELILSITSLSEKHMKSLLLSAAVMTMILSACGKETAPSAQPPAKSSSEAAPAPAAPAGEMTKEDKEKAMEAAKAAAKSASKGAY